MIAALVGRFAWIVNHPLEVLGLLAILLAVAYLLGGVIVAFSAYTPKESPRAPGCRKDRVRL